MFDKKYLYFMEVTMIIDINKHDFTIIWDGIYYFALSNYPHISDWELQKLLDL